MKSMIIIICILLVILLLPISGVAQNQERWNRSCKWKTSGLTTVYRLDADAEAQETIPANTHVRVYDTDTEMKRIRFMINGKIRTGKVYASDLIECTHTDIKGDQPEKEPPAVIAQDTVQFELEQSETASSKEKSEGAIEEIPATELVYSDEVPEDKRIAVIHAPRTGIASLRNKASEKDDVFKKCKAGTIVSVLEYDDEFCKINYNGTEGYVYTNALTFHSPSEQPVITGVLTYNGNTTGQSIINVRNDPNSDSAKIIGWSTGTVVLVYDEVDGWYDVEANGMRGFVMVEFVKLDI